MKSIIEAALNNKSKILTRGTIAILIATGLTLIGKMIFGGGDDEDLCVIDETVDNDEVNSDEE